jgi:hypothetical protein
VIIEAGFVALLVAAYRKGKDKGNLTPEREEMYLEALATIRGPNAPALFRKLATGFDKYGLPLQAKMLRLRADYLDAPPEKKAQRRAVLAQAMASTNPDAIEVVAKRFEDLTATGVARNLRQRAKELRQAKMNMQPVNSSDEIQGTVQEAS